MNKIFGLVLAMAGLSSAYATENVLIVPFNEAITFATSEIFHRAIETAKAKKYTAILIEMDTPGGYLDATHEIVKEILASEIPVLVWVAPSGSRAASAGAMIALSAHFVGMAPSTNIGAATPINASGSDLGSDIKNKIENDTLAFVEGLAQKRNRNVIMAKEFVSKATSLTASAALEKNVIDGVYANREELWTAFRKKFSTNVSYISGDVSYVLLSPTLKENFLGLISNPNVAYGLMALGVLGIYVEVTHPGLILPGAVGALSLTLGAMTMKIIPIRPGALVLLLIGLILFGIEVLTPLPTMGVAGIGGAISLFLSGLFLLDQSQTDLKLSLSLWLPIFFLMVGFMALLAWAATKALRSNYRQGFAELVGQRAQIIKEESGEEGKIELKGELWNVRWSSSAGSILGQKFLRGQKVKVVKQEGLTLIVEEEK